MLENEYDEIFDEYKKYIVSKSKYDPYVSKYHTSRPAKFPYISLVLSDNKDTNFSTVDGFERYNQFYFTTNIYSKDIVKGQNIIVSSHEVIKELSFLTNQFFCEILGTKKTLDKPTPNLDTSILRKTIQHQCLIGNVRGNIIRR